MMTLTHWDRTGPSGWLQQNWGTPHFLFVSAEADLVTILHNYTILNLYIILLYNYIYLI